MVEIKPNIVLKTIDLKIGYQNKSGTILIGEQIDLEFYEGELIGLVGANGIGKSTLLRTLTKVQPKLDGKIVINETNLEDFDLNALAMALSVVLTESIASKNLSAYEVIALGRQPYTNWFGNLNSEDLEKIDEAISRTQIDGFINKKCFELSDGQLQKVMIARALAQDTDLIILDEPTTHLDMYHKAQILTLLRTLSKETGKTILFSSHEIDLAIQLCDKMIIMTKEQSLLDTPEGHIAQGHFSRLFPKDLIVFDPETKAFRVNK
ncbi:MAG: ABC transporter ATP-binding protein [Bacteroidia bacterium]|nr:ABC transporter ATP-binding protein [Bacteroidia bacterium]NND25079.1 ABC transporter ATP-binding protein [Flavobacteriaceae bacterium]MBT8279417.1 ABC transporter ATP-binding protein [Bacteroidia bacterium]NNK59367.1 ABC transporter ATP-binding protein [Flavobacteriaceae bacterium]NNL33390.1 ABC transporter ATP-binding protein [Flavobacteriaceae bacterium]